MANHGMVTDDAEVTGDLLGKWAAWQPTANALTAHSALGSRVTSTYAEIDDAVTRVSLGLIDMGIQKGQRVAFLLSNNAGHEGALTYLGTHRCGAIAVPINGRSTPREVVPLAEHAGISVLAFEPMYAEHASAIREALDPAPAMIQAGGEVPEWAMDFSALLPPFAADAAHQLPHLCPQDDADWLFTSGTVSLPKCVMLNHANCVAQAHMLPATLGLREDDVYLTPFPFFTSSGVHTSFLTSLGAGAHYIMSTNVDADALIAEIAADGATVIGAVPSLYTFMTRSPKAKTEDLSLVRIAYHGGAPVSPHQVRSYKRLLPRAELIHLYGQTESGLPGTYLPGKYNEAKAGSIGKGGMPGVRARVVDPETDNVLEGAGVGEVCLQSAAVMRGYYQNEEATAATLRDGWLHTGDLVRVDEDGFMFIHDRLKDTIIRGGHNIASLEVENVLTQHPAILEAAVVAKAHPDLGEDLVAFLVVDGDVQPAPEELQEFCKGQLSEHKIPRDIRFIDALPRNPTGKLLKRNLRDQVSHSHA